MLTKIEAWLILRCADFTKPYVRDYYGTTFRVFLFATAMSWLERFTREMMVRLLIVEWPPTAWFHSEFRAMVTFTPAHLLADLGNGVVGSIMLGFGPVMAGLFFRVVVVVMRRVGLAWPVHLLGLRLTYWPNLDLVLWPLLAAAIQWASYDWMLRRLEENGRWPGLLFRIKHAEELVLVAVIVIGVGVPLAVYVGFFGLAWLQISLVWLFQT